MKESLRCILGAAALFTVLAACRSGRPEDQVRKAFETCRAAVEAGDAVGAAQCLDPAFRGPEGMDKATARLFLADILRREKIGVTALRNEVAVQLPDAVQEVDVVITNRGSALLPEDASRRSFRLRWRKAKGAWLLREIQPLDRSS